MDIILGSNVDIVLDFDWLRGKKVKITYLLMEKYSWIRYSIRGNEYY
jgi:hypothetical protein